MGVAKFDRVKSLVAEGWSVADALDQVGMSRTAFDAQRQKRGAHLRRSRTYTPSRVEEVKQRVRAGELLKDVCADMGMDPKNLARWCRKHGMKIFTKKALQENYSRRHRSKAKTFSRGSKMPRIVKHIKNGESDVAIAKALDVTRSYVAWARKQLESGALDEKLASCT